MIRWKRLEDIFARRLEDVLKISWICSCKTSWRRFEDVLKMSWRRLQNFLKTSWQDVLKTYGQDKYIGLDQDVLKTSSEDVRLRRTYSSWSRRLQGVFKTSSDDEYKRRLQDVFIKTNVCLLVRKDVLEHLFSRITRWLLLNILLNSRENKSARVSIL